MRKKADSLQQFVALRSALVQERDIIQKRLQEIDRALDGGAIPSQSNPQRSATKGRRLKNSMSLREAVVKAVGKKPLTKHEILSEVQRVGYRFGGKKPIKSLEVFLYTAGKKLLQRVDGKFVAR